MKVTLITHTPEPEKIIASAAKLCYSNASIRDIMNHMTDEKIYTFIEFLMGLGHESPIEHCTFTFGIEGISRSTSLQLVRHRIASYSQKSQRYCNERQFEYVTPHAIEDDDELKHLYAETMNDIQHKYDIIRNKLIDRYVNEGMIVGEAEKKANEDARYVLPNACETSLVCTMNIRSLFNFFKLRCCNRAQWEIRELATEMYKLCLSVAPHIFSHAGPSCANGKCSEGVYSCGKGKEKKEEFDKYLSEVCHDR